MLFRFVDCILDTGAYSLHRDGEAKRLAPKVFQVLHYLLVHRDRVITKQELSEQIWPDLFVSDGTMETTISAVRRAVGDSGRAQRIIRTLPGHGYQFIESVDIEGETTDGDETGLSSAVGEAELSPEPPSRALEPTPMPPPDPDIPLPSVASSVAAPDAPVATDPGSERKLVTVLCCALGLPPAGTLHLALDTLYDLIETLFDMVEDVARPYGGTLQPATGDRLVAIFGAPITHEDHAQRATLAALELNRRLHEAPGLLRPPSGEPLALRIGLCTGLVAIRGMGSGLAERLLVIGEAVSQAVILCDQATPGTILCNAGTARLIYSTAQVDALSPQMASQAGERVYHVQHLTSARTDVSRVGERTLTDFVNRERELEQLLELLSEVETGRGHAVGVVGEPGIGKSRLTHELRRRTAGQSFAYVQGRCLSYGAVTPYLPVLALVRQRCDLIATDAPDIVAAKVHLAVQRSGMPSETWAPYLLWLLGVQTDADVLVGLSPEVLKQRLFETLLQLLAAGCTQRPLIVEIEDLHWLDPTSEAFLTVLVERLPGLRMLLLCTYRPGYDPPWMNKSYTTQIALRRLAPTNSLRIVQSVLAEMALSSTLEQELLTKADGNPFFLEELTLSVTEQASQDAHVTVPDTIHAVVAARMDRLPGDEKRLLQIASVLGKDISFELLKALTQLPDDDLSQQLSTLQSTEFLYQTQAFPEPIYNFGHVLTQDVAYQSLLQRTRRDYHRQVAEVLEERFASLADLQPEYLAYHCTEAGLDQQAILYWQRAGQRDVERSGNVEAIEHFSKALELLRAQPETPARAQMEIELQLALGATLLMIKGHTAPEVEQAYAWAYELCQQAGEPQQYFSALVGMWRFHLGHGRLDTTRQLAEMCLTLAEEQEAPELLQESHFMCGLTLYYLGELELALTHLEQSLALYQAHSRAQSRDGLILSGGTEPGVVCLSAMAWVLWKLGYWKDAKAKSREAITLAETLAHDYSLCYALAISGYLHQWSGEREIVDELAERVVALANEHGFVRWLQAGLILRGWNLAAQGQVEAGVVQIRQSVTMFQSMGWDLGMPHMLSVLVEAYRHSGELEAGLEVVDEALALVQRTQERCNESELHRLRGELLQDQSALRGDAEAIHEEVETHFQRALEIARRQMSRSQELRAAVSLSRLWHQQGKQAEAYELLKAIYDVFETESGSSELLEAQAMIDLWG